MDLFQAIAISEEMGWLSRAMWKLVADIKKGRIKRSSLKMVGATGFEPATPWSQTRCATKLRHAPY